MSGGLFASGSSAPSACSGSGTNGSDPAAISLSTLICKSDKKKQQNINLHLN